MRERYEATDPQPCSASKQTLLAGAERARQIATPFMRRLRSAVGLRSLGAARKQPRPPKSARPPCPPSSNTARKDGQFYFKLVTTR
jgi:tryptophanyl-tRNA synthetase